MQRLFPNQVEAVAVCIPTANLEKLSAERRALLTKLEVAVAYTRAKPHQPRPTVKVNRETNKVVGLCGGRGGEQIDAVGYYETELARLNTEIDLQRTDLLTLRDERNNRMKMSEKETDTGHDDG